MDNGDINILKLKLKLDYIKKQEIKLQLLKSIIQNKKIKLSIRYYAKILFMKRKNNFFKFKHICLKNNRNAAVFNNFYFSRHIIKDFAIENKLQNIKINSW